ncbi:DsbA family protein [Microbacterium sp. gxy059]|uniref:DsbA family protein n=1 Tax=Microbacterium sp. gxy059 TaxID=2957199 RepID=UPI003D98FA3D
MGSSQARRGRPGWLVPAGIVAVGATLVGVALWAGPDRGEQAAPAPSESVEPAPSHPEVERRDPADPLAWGEVDAPVGLVVFSDYQCPFCATWSEEVLPELEPLVDAGDLRIEWRDVNFSGPVSDRAARAAAAAGRQDAFAAYHDALFAGGEPRSESALTEEALTALAEEIGLDVDRFAEDFAAETTAAQVGENVLLGFAHDVQLTPTFFLDGEMIAGAQPAEVFLAGVEEALSARG